LSREQMLAPLAPAVIDELPAELLGSDPPLAGLVQLVRDRAAGNPFLIEERVGSLVEAGSLVGERGTYRLAAPVRRGRGAGERAGLARRGWNGFLHRRTRCCRRRR
jgi:hypothetical protein